MGSTSWVSLLDAREWPADQGSRGGRNEKGSNSFSLLGRLACEESATVLLCTDVNGAQFGRMRRSPSLRSRASLENRGGAWQVRPSRVALLVLLKNIGGKSSASCGCTEARSLSQGADRRRPAHSSVAWDASE